MTTVASTEAAAGTLHSSAVIFVFITHPCLHQIKTVAKSWMNISRKSHKSALLDRLRLRHSQWISELNINTRNMNGEIFIYGTLHSTYVMDTALELWSRRWCPFCQAFLVCLCAILSGILASRPCRRHCGTAASYWSTRVIVHCPGCRQRSHWSALLCCTPSSHNLPHCTVCTHFITWTLDHVWSTPTVGVESVSASLVNLDRMLLDAA